MAYLADTNILLRSLEPALPRRWSSTTSRTF